MKRNSVVAMWIVGLAVAAQGRAAPLAPERVERIKAYLAGQECPMPEIDGDNYGNREGVPTGPFYYGFTLDPLEKLKGFKKIGHLPCRDAHDTSSTFFSAGLEMGNMLGEKIVPYLAAAGFKRARLNYAWRKMEKEKGVYDFAEADRMVDALRAAGIQPWFYGGYGNELYYGKVEVQNKLSSSFWDAPCYHGPEAVEGWNNFIRALARHFKGRVELYEIWNELDARWYKDGLNAHKTIGVAQAAQDFTAFYRRTMEIIKEVDPKARGTISLGSLFSGWNVGLAQAGGVDETDGDAAHDDALFEKIAGRAGLVGDDGAVFLQQGVEEGGLAGIGASGEDNEGAFAQEASLVPRGEQGPHAGAHRAGARGKCAGSEGVGDVALVEVQRGLDVGAQGDERVVEGGDAARKGAAELFGGGADGPLGLGADEVHHGFGLGEVEATVEKGASREFAGRGGFDAEGRERFEHAAGGEPAAVDLEFDDGFAGVAAAAGEG